MCVVSSVPNSCKRSLECPSGHCYKCSEGQGEESLPASLPAVPPKPYTHATKVNSFLTDASQTWDWVAEPSSPAQRHLGQVPRTAPSSPHHAWEKEGHAKILAWASQSCPALLQPSSTKIQRAVGEQITGVSPAMLLQ